LEAMPDPNISYHFAWRNVFPKRSVFFMAEREGEVCGLLPLIRSGDGSYLKAPPLLSGTHLLEMGPAVSSSLISTAVREARTQGAYKLSILDVQRHIHPLLRPRSPRTCTFVLRTNTDIEEIRRRYSKSLLRNLRIARRSGVHVESLEGSGIDRFHSLYRLSMERLGLKARPLEYFNRLKDNLGQSLHFVVATVKGKDASALAFLSFGRTVTLLHGGWDFSLRKTNAESFVDDWAIEWASRNGYQKVELGPSILDERDGPYRYKARFGATALPVFRHEKLVSLRRWFAWKLRRGWGKRGRVGLTDASRPRASR